MRYKAKSSDIYSWNTLKSPRFVPTMFDNEEHCCGTNALAMLTGISPSKIVKERDRVGYWSYKKMLSYLNVRGYTTVEVTVAEVTNRMERLEIVSYDHVLLIGQYMFRDEGTWTVVHNYMLYHNFDKDPLRPLEFLNNPSERIYIVSHPTWKNKEW